MGPQPGARCHGPQQPDPEGSARAAGGGRERPASAKWTNPPRGQCLSLLSIVGSSDCDFIPLNLPLCTPLWAGAAVRPTCLLKTPSDKTMAGQNEQPLLSLCTGPQATREGTSRVMPHVQFSVPVCSVRGYRAVLQGRRGPCVQGLGMCQCLCHTWGCPSPGL